MAEVIIIEFPHNGPIVQWIGSAVEGRCMHMERYEEPLRNVCKNNGLKTGSNKVIDSISSSLYE